MVDGDTAQNDEIESDIGLSDDTIASVRDALHDENFDQLDDLVAELLPSDLAELLEKVGNDDTIALVQHLQDRIPPETFAHLGRDNEELVLKQLKPKQIGSIIADLDTDDAIDLIEFFDDNERKSILRYVSKKTRTIVEEGLTYEQDSAGRMMQRDFIAAPKFWSVGKTLDYLKALKDDLPEDIYKIFIVDPMHHVIGEVSLAALLRAKRTTKLDVIKSDAPYLIPVAMDQEEVAHIFRRDTLLATPVIDDNNRLIGVIRLDDIVEVVDEEAEEDIFRLAGLEDSDIYRPIWGTAKSRFSWLVLNLITAILASFAIGVFEATLQEIVALAILMPIVASMGGNAGTQTLTVAVRALATKELSTTNAWRVTMKEMGVGLINGITFALISGGVAWAWFENPMIGVIIGMAMVVNLIIAGLMGMVIPLTLHRLKIDPALASAVFLTTITDIIGFVVFLGLATAFLL